MKMKRLLNRLYYCVDDVIGYVLFIPIVGIFCFFIKCTNWFLLKIDEIENLKTREEKELEIEDDESE